MNTLSQFRSFTRPVQLLLLNQLTINTGFYMLIPYLADHLANDLALATWLVGLILGVRNFSQQGMFLIGGALADRFGYKPLIVAGCALRTAGFALLGLVDTVPALIVASAATGFAGALFNPAVRAYLTHDAGERRVEAFALFSVFYQTGILVGPLIGLALTGVSFRLTCVVAAGVFAMLTVLQIRALPQRTSASAVAENDTPTSTLGQWRGIVANRPFLLFSVAMTGSYVMSFQVYLALPLEARRIAGEGRTSTIAVAALFGVSGVVTILGQLRITAWCRRHWSPGRSIATGLVIMGAAFLPPLAAARHTVPQGDTAALIIQLSLLVLAAGLLALGTAIVFPIEMDTVVALSHNRLVATHYGFYNTVCGVGILLGNLGTGSALDAGRRSGTPELPWLALILVGLLCAAGIRALETKQLLPAGSGNTPRARGRHRLRGGNPARIEPARATTRAEIGHPGSRPREEQPGTGEHPQPARRPQSVPARYGPQPQLTRSIGRYQPAPSARGGMPRFCTPPPLPCAPITPSRTGPASRTTFLGQA